jgi:hypothetical protein
LFAKLGDKLLFPDEGQLHLTGHADSQNVRTWSKEKHGTPLHPVGIVGPIFFENTINSEQYTDIGHEFLGRVTEEEIIAAQFQQHSAKRQSTVDHARAIPVVRRSNRFESTMASTFDRFSPSDFSVCSYNKDNAYRMQSE